MTASRAPAVPKIQLFACVRAADAERIKPAPSVADAPDPMVMLNAPLMATS